MQDTLKMDGKTKLSKHKMVLLVSELINGKAALTPNPEDPNPPDPPWPWKHIVNKAFDRMLYSISSQGNPLTLAALNPQPLPPRLHFSISLAQEVVERAVMMQEIADGLSQGDDQRGIIIVGGYINKFVDEICPTPPIIKFPKKRWPFPPEPDPRWTGLELAIIGTHFLNEARLADNNGMQDVLNKAGEKLLETAVERMY